MPPPTPALTSHRPKRSLGQNFLVDTAVALRVVDALNIAPTDTVVEVGPGRGALTGALAKRSGHLTAIEMDDLLAPELASQFEGDPAVTVIHGDALQIDLSTLVGSGTPYKMVGNLPYNVASPIIRRFLTAAHPPELLVVMLQREVAESMAAEPGNMTYLSVEVQLRTSVELRFLVHPTAFQPEPKVTSAVVALTPHTQPLLELDSEERFLELVRAGFSARRKQLHNSLSRGLAPKHGEVQGDVQASVQAMIQASGIDGKRRAQTLSLQEWAALYKAWPRQETGQEPKPERDTGA
jgi:16S rRNA (adenine1518-N6/adenine1519-N6)-dimethyltransferase